MAANDENMRQENPDLVFLLSSLELRGATETLALGHQQNIPRLVTWLCLLQGRW